MEPREDFPSAPPSEFNIKPLVNFGDFYLPKPPSIDSVSSIGFNKLPATQKLPLLQPKGRKIVRRSKERLEEKMIGMIPQFPVEKVEEKCDFELNEVPRVDSDLSIVSELSIKSDVNPLLKSIELYKEATNTKSQQPLSPTVQKTEETSPQTKILFETCRYCQRSETRKNLISPCMCQSPMNFVHRRCLDQWRISSPTSHSLTQCEVCKFSYVFESDCLTSPSTPTIWQWVKYISCVTFDISIVIGIYTSIVLLFSTFVYFADFSNKYRYEVFVIFPKLWIFDLFTSYIIGNVLSLSFLGIVAIFVLLFVGVKFLWKKKKQRKRVLCNSPEDWYYSRRRRYYSGFSFLDYFFLWYFISHVSCNMNDFVCDAGGVTCCVPEGVTQNLENCDCAPDEESGKVILIVAGVVMVSALLVVIGVLFGVIFFTFLTYKIVRKRMVILYKKDQVVELVVKDLK